jgi:antitoxin VapB
MALNIKNVEVERLAGEVANLAHESLREYLEQNVWPVMPAGELGQVMSREEEDRILGYGPQGY